jgi:hypothetical protein
MNYKKLNIILGWGVFVVAAVVYMMTAERTTSFWDCGEYIATAYKLQVGHPPGAPFFQLMGRFFSLFAFGDVSNVALMVNYMSALSSAFTILFLFWSITYLAKKMITKATDAQLTDAKIFTILGSGLVGALAYTFSDSFWFSAVEGEVYAMSSFFTAIVFWAMLRWEAVAEEKSALRWLILIAFLIGLSIGVHLLNLLAIPALALIYYFKKYETTWKGIVVAMVIGVAVLAFILMGLIPLVPALAGLFERIFVNGFGLPFNTGTVIYFIVIIGAIVLGLRYTHRKGKVILNTIVLSVAVLLIGYSSFFILVIRSNANTPIDENNPENAISLLAYLNREQYGTWPIFSGHYYNAPMVDMEDGNPVYTKKYLVYQDSREVASFFEKGDARKFAEKSGGKIKGRYVITDERISTVPIYDDRFKTVFPRMWSQQRSHHKSAYQEWAHKNKGERVQVGGTAEKPEFTYIPTMGENISFFVRYQLGHMYFRYFMWNFAGRQNDIQGHGGPLHGNWFTGIKALDKALLGPQDNLPDNLLHNKGTNRFFLLPLLLGIIGLVFHTSGHYKDSLVVMLLFFMTGIAIVFYLNQYPYQPRERDYSYAASFYAFAIWIGLGIIGIVQWLDKHFKNKIIPIAVSAAMLVLVPGIMAREGWDDHDRSNKGLALEVAKNYLNACKKNGVVFTNGDNDTFPLWYAQEVENVRTDIKVVNLSLFNTDWYVDQSARRTYEAPGIPLSFTKEQYIQGSRDYVFILGLDDPMNTKGPEIIINNFMDKIIDREPDIYGAPVNEIRSAVRNAFDAAGINNSDPAAYQKLTDPAFPFSGLMAFINARGSEQNRESNAKMGLNTDLFKELSNRAKIISDRIVYGYIDLDLLMDWIKLDDPTTKVRGGTGRPMEWFPTNKVRIRVDSAKVVASGLVPVEDAGKIQKYVEWEIKDKGIQKNHVMMLDFLAANQWERPVHFAITTGDDMYLNLMQWFRHDGMVYTLVPIKYTGEPVFLFTMLAHGTTNNNVLWDILMSPEKADYTSLYRSNVHYDETARRPLVSYRNNFTRLALALIQDGRMDSAITVLKKSEELLPDKVLNYDASMIPVIRAYFEAGDSIQGAMLADIMMTKTEQEFNYYISFSSQKRGVLKNEITNTYRTIYYIDEILKQHNQTALSERAKSLFAVIGTYVQQ